MPFLLLQGAIFWLIIRVCRKALDFIVSGLRWKTGSPVGGASLELKSFYCILHMLRRYYGVTVMCNKLTLNVRNEMQSVAVWGRIDLHLLVTARWQIVSPTNCLAWLRSGSVCVQCMRPVKWYFLNQLPINATLTTAKSRASTIYRRVGTQRGLCD